MRTHYFKYYFDQATQEYYCDREITQAQWEQDWSRYWSRTKKGLGR